MRQKLTSKCFHFYSQSYVNLRMSWKEFIIFPDTTVCKLLFLILQGDSLLIHLLKAKTCKSPIIQGILPNLANSFLCILVSTLSPCYCSPRSGAHHLGLTHAEIFLEDSLPQGLHLLCWFLKDPPVLIHESDYGTLLHHGFPFQGSESEAIYMACHTFYELATTCFYRVVSCQSGLLTVNSSTIEWLSWVTQALLYF